MLTHKEFSNISHIMEETGWQEQNKQTGGDEGNFVLHKEGKKLIQQVCKTDQKQLEGCLKSDMAALKVL